MAIVWANTTMQCDGRADDGDDTNGTAQTYNAKGGKCADNETTARSAAHNNADALAGGVHIQVGANATRLAVATSSNKAISSFTIQPNTFQRLFVWLHVSRLKMKYDLDFGLSVKIGSGKGRLRFGVWVTGATGTVPGSLYQGRYDVTQSTTKKDSIDINLNGALIHTMSNPGAYVDHPSSPAFAIMPGTYTCNFEIAISGEADGMINLDGSATIDPTFA
jgi:hypothetical protein